MASDNELEEFLTEADSVLSEQNALTTIELNLTETICAARRFLEQSLYPAEKFKVQI